MIKITKEQNKVIVELPIKTLEFDREAFDLISDHIYFLTRKSYHSKEIIRQKGKIEELNMSHWMCICNKVQTQFNDHTKRSLDINHLVSEYLI